jgi:hypothetical protein
MIGRNDTDHGWIVRNLLRPQHDPRPVIVDFVDQVGLLGLRSGRDQLGIGVVAGMSTSATDILESAESILQVGFGPSSCNFELFGYDC